MAHQRRSSVAFDGGQVREAESAWQPRSRCGSGRRREVRKLAGPPTATGTTGCRYDARSLRGLTGDEPSVVSRAANQHWVTLRRCVGLNHDGGLSDTAHRSPDNVKRRVRAGIELFENFRGNLLIDLIEFFEFGIGHSHRIAKVIALSRA